MALCVNPNESYVKVKNGDYTCYLAGSFVDTVLNSEYTVLERFTGKDLEFKEYEPLFDFVHPAKKAYYVTCDTYVTLTDGTGVVHIAPAFGEDDSRWAENTTCRSFSWWIPKGEMTKEAKWAGTFCKKADPLVLKDLEERGLLFSAPVFAAQLSALLEM